MVTLPVLIVQGSGPDLFGRDWLRRFRLDWEEICHKMHAQEVDGLDKDLNKILKENQEVFKEGLGTLEGFKADIRVNPSARPRFFKARPVPYALKKKIDQELERLQQEGTLEPVLFSKWAAPIIPVLKPDGRIRICGDYRITVNQVVQRDEHPIPKIDDLFSSLAGGKLFSKLDLSHAYQQLLLEEESKQYFTINTHRGLFRYNRLPFGVSSAQAILKRVMESTLQGIPHTVVYLDDILVTGRTHQEHLWNLQIVLTVKTGGIATEKRKMPVSEKGSAIPGLSYRPRRPPPN